MSRYNDEKLLGTIVILGDVVAGSSPGTHEDPPEDYVTVRFRHGSIAPADGPQHDDLAGRLLNEVDYGDVDPDGLVAEAIRYIHKTENGESVASIVEEEPIVYGEYPITFGQQYGSALYGCDPHPALGIYSARDGYLIVEAQSGAEARERAFRVIGEAWAFDYDKVGDLDPEGNGWYPRGEIARIRLDETLVVHEHEED